MRGLIIKLLYKSISDVENTNLQTKFLEKLKLSISEIQSLEKRTKRQQQCEEWHLEKRKRLVNCIII